MDKSYDYYFTPISDTPFSLGVAIPSDYGSGATKINITESINELNVSDYFAGENWKVNKEW